MAKIAGYVSFFAVGAVLGGLAGTAYRSGRSSEVPSDPVVAEMGGESIPASVAYKDNKRRIFELEETLFKLKQQSVNDYLENRLLTAESKSRGTPIDRIIVQEVGTEVGPVSDKEVDAFLQEKGIPADTPEKKGEVKEYLKFRKAMERRHAFVDRLKAQAKVKVLLQEPPAPTVKVDLDGYPSWGNAVAPVTIVEFADFECPFCQRAVGTVEKIKATYGPDKVRLVFRYLTIDSHPRSVPSALAAQCAQDQGKFWEYHQMLYNNQQKLEEKDLKDYAATVGLDGAKFAECFGTKKYQALVDRSRREADGLGLDSTPTFLINGVIVPGAQPFEVLKEKIDAALRKLAAGPSSTARS